MALNSEWARNRKWMVIVVLGAVVIAALAILAFAILYKTPTCTDTKQDGTETGIDCGGSCATLCSSAVSPASIRFARTLTQSGRTDLTAYIDNPNKNAYAKNTHLTVDLFGVDGSDIQKHVSISLPAGTPTPLYLPGVTNNSSPIRQVFISFDPGYPIWTTATQAAVPPVVSNISIQNPNGAPRITATVSNQTAYQVSNIPLIATVFDSDNLVVAASQTIVPSLPAQGTATVIFTWNEPFAGPAARVEIIPVSSLPGLIP